MFKFINKKKNNKGFTLVELVIVVAILAILVGVLAPQYTKYVEKSRKAADVSNVENLVTVLKTAASDSTDTLPAGNYKITITADRTTITGPDAATKLTETVNEFAGDNWANVTLKSTRWTTKDGTKTAIGATVKIADDGKVTVEYTPADMTKQ